VSDKFAAKALGCLADGLEDGLIDDMLNKDIRLTVQLHAIGQNLSKGLGTAALADHSNISPSGPS